MLNPSRILLPFLYTRKRRAWAKCTAQGPSNSLFFPPSCTFLMSVPDLTCLPFSPSSSAPKPVWSNPGSSQLLVMTPGTPGQRFAVEEPDKELESRFRLRGAQGGLDHLHWYPCHSLHPSRDALLAPQIFPEEGSLQQAAFGGAKGKAAFRVRVVGGSGTWWMNAAVLY